MKWLSNIGLSVFWHESGEDLQHRLCHYGCFGYINARGQRAVFHRSLPDCQCICRDDLTGSARKAA